ESVVFLRDLRDVRDRVREAAGRFVPAQGHGPEVVRVEGRCDLVRLDRRTTFERERGRRREDLTQLVEPFAELAVHQVQHAVRFSEEAGHGRFQAGRAGTGEDGDLATCAEEVLREATNLGKDLLEL